MSLRLLLGTSSVALLTAALPPPLAGASFLLPQPQATSIAASVSTARNFGDFVILNLLLRRTGLKDRVDEGRQRRSLREDLQRSNQQHGDDDGKQPPLLPHAH